MHSCGRFSTEVPSSSLSRQSSAFHMANVSMEIKFLIRKFSTAQLICQSALYLISNCSRQSLPNIAMFSNTLLDMIRIIGNFPYSLFALLTWHATDIVLDSEINLSCQL